MLELSNHERLTFWYTKHKAHQSLSFFENLEGSKLKFWLWRHILYIPILYRYRCTWMIILMNNPEMKLQDKGGGGGALFYIDFPTQMQIIIYIIYIYNINNIHSVILFHKYLPLFLITLDQSELTKQNLREFPHVAFFLL